MEGVDYKRIVNSIVKSSGLNVNDIEEKVEAKQRKISGLISKEGAAQIVAAELGVAIENENLKIEELGADMRKVNVVGKVIEIFPVRTFTRNDKESKVVNFIIADETSNTRAVLWDLHHIKLIEEGKIKVGDVIEISNSSVRESEIHLGSFSELKLSNEPMREVKTEKIMTEKKISDFKISNNISTRAFIVQIFDPKFFDVCTDCKKKVTPEGEGFVCGEHGKVANERRALINFVLDDGTESIRAVLFHDQIPELGLSKEDLENAESLSTKKQEILGKELIFSGTVRKNSFFDNLELIISQIKEANVDELIKEMENKA
jgi:ssDNA-binding replication factor A large subunit